MQKTLKRLTAGLRKRKSSSQSSHCYRSQARLDDAMHKDDGLSFQNIVIRKLVRRGFYHASPSPSFTPGDARCAIQRSGIIV